MGPPHPTSLSLVLWDLAGCAQAKGREDRPGITHVASEQIFLWPQKGRRTVAKARPWVNISVTWDGR